LHSERHQGTKTPHRGNPINGAVLLMGCDKSTPSLLRVLDFLVGGSGAEVPLDSH
jgi:hypothetical protein